ncbi:hypothetical protein lbkm_1795 [Lachnospiraceae bacterium KM106-2]|nr:hypothetical protein lbkm_1795 [Lachnospiraceae bacterium KM106-2]
MKDRNGNVVNDFSVVIADEDRTNTNEKIECTTSGTAWTLVTSITLWKDIVKRVDPADQFVIKISGTQINEMITTGATEGH